MACEACNVKFSFFTRKKQCMDCLRYFCSECVIKRLDKILSCDSCNMLSRRPLIRSLIIQTRSKDMRQYLLAKKVPIKGCIEKEDLIKLLMTFANGNNNYWNTETTENIRRENGGNSEPNQSITRNHEYSEQALNYVHETNATRSDYNEIPGTISRIDFYSDERTEPVRQEEEKISNNPIKLSDINALSELEHLSVKQLKNLLSTNKVDYKGCIERCELLNKASKLWQEYEQSRTMKMEISDENLCKVCWDEPIECVILECGHMVCCLNCGKQMSECPICKQYIVRIIRFFKS